MTAVKAEPSTRTDDDTVYVFEDAQLYDALVDATQRELDGYADSAFLAQRQDRIAEKVRRAVRDTLRRDLPEQLAQSSPWHLSRALGAYITREVRKRQGWAFERRLAEEDAQLEPSGAGVHEALAAEIEQLTKQVLADYDDERLLSQSLTRTIAVAQFVVREALLSTAPALVGRVSRRQLERLLEEHVGVEVRKRRGGAMIRRAEIEEGPAPEIELVLTEVVNGVEVYEIRSHAARANNRPA